MKSACSLSRTSLAALSLFAAAAIVGCASPSPSGSPTTTPSPASPMPASASVGGKAQHDECLVCKMNADLACVDVTVDKQTPTASYQGKSYHFCSDECRDKFLKNPEKYVATAQR